MARDDHFLSSLRRSDELRDAVLEGRDRDMAHAKPFLARILARIARLSSVKRFGDRILAVAAKVSDAGFYAGRGLAALLLIGIVDPQQELPDPLRGEQIIMQCGADIADLQPTGRGRGETGGDGQAAGSLKGTNAALAHGCFSFDIFFITSVVSLAGGDALVIE